MPKAQGLGGPGHDVAPVGVLIDLDGTLVDTMGDFQAVVAASLALAGWPSCPPDVVAHGIGQGTAHLLDCVLRAVFGRPPTSEEAARLMALYLEVYDGLNGQAAQAFAGAGEALRAWHGAGLRLACVTNKPQALAEGLIEAMGWSAELTQVLGGDALPRRKPDPMPLLEMARRWGCEPGRLWMVGDSRNDAQAAEAAGMPVYLLRHGYNHGEPVDEVPADGHFDDWTCLMAAGWQRRPA